jgi:YHS domain-containing protein
MKVSALAASAWLWTGMPVLAQKDAARPAQAGTVSRFAEAASTWADIQLQVKDLAELIREQRLDEVHPVAFEIRDLVRTLPDKSQALSAASRVRLAAQVRVVDRLAEQLDRYGDDGKQAEAARQAQSLARALATIKSLYPAGVLATAPAPAAVSSKDRELYLTPGGAYTQADIEANGSQLPAQKFRGVKVSHDLKPAVGDRICPVTLTKANPSYSWTIGGKAYLFCCPPCLEEFLTKAKQAPASLQPPDAYVKKGG